jgi:hypothetical protein
MTTTPTTAPHPYAYRIWHSPRTPHENETWCVDACDIGRGLRCYPTRAEAQARADELFGPTSQRAQASADHLRSLGFTVIAPRG